MSTLFFVFFKFFSIFFLVYIYCVLLSQNQQHTVKQNRRFRLFFCVFRFFLKKVRKTFEKTLKKIASNRFYSLLQRDKVCYTETYRAPVPYIIVYMTEVKKAMPIRIQADLPAIEVLESENIFVMTHERAALQDIRPLKIAILNLMPTKIETETQLLRLLGNTPLQVDVELLHMASHVSRNTSSYHLNTFYKTFNDVKNQRFDGLIITGAPVEKMPFEEVDYWDEMCAIMEWSKTHVYSVLYICWGAQAGLYYHYGIQKHLMKEKLSGIYNHHVLNPYHPLMRGFDDNYFAPHSRYTEVYLDDIKKHDELIVLSLSDLAGVHIVAEKSGRKFFVTGHAEYDRDTLAKEYFRDINKGLNPKVPYNYFPDDDDQKTPPFTWRSNAHLLVANWLNYYVYQQTPYDLNHLEG